MRLHSKIQDGFKGESYYQAFIRLVYDVQHFNELIFFSEDPLLNEEARAATEKAINELYRLCRECPLDSMDVRSSLLEVNLSEGIVMGITPKYDRCRRPPRGWYCTRNPFHDGPCAAWPTRWTRFKKWLMK
jgi:hypothetical protein